jgi:hypothetical protein
VVIAINIINAGFGYTGTPTIVISPPFVRPPVLAIARAVFLTFTGASTGTNYQLQAFRDGVSWTNVGEAFTANAETYNQYVDGGAGSASYRLALWPVPYAASATAQVAYGFVVGVTLGGGGYGYVSAPTVRITGGGGNGAQATTTISNGMVTAVNVLDAGYGYSSAPTVEIDAPPVVALTPTVSKAVRLDCTRLEANLNYQLLASPDFVNWTNCAGPFTATAGTNSEYVGSETGLLFFRLQYVP